MAMDARRFTRKRPPQAPSSLLFGFIGAWYPNFLPVVDEIQFAMTVSSLTPNNHPNFDQFEKTFPLVHSFSPLKLPSSLVKFFASSLVIQILPCQPL